MESPIQQITVDSTLPQVDRLVDWFCARALPWFLLLVLADWLCALFTQGGVCTCIHRAVLVTLVLSAIVLLSQACIRAYNLYLVRPKIIGLVSKRVVWIGHYLSENEAIEVPRDYRFRANKMPYHYLVATTPLSIIIALLIIMLCIPLWIGKRVGAPTWPVVFVVIAMIVLACYGWPALFQRSLRLGAGILQICTVNHLTRKVNIRREIPLKKAQMTIRAVSPTSIYIQWREGNRDVSENIRNMPIEFCYYVLIAAITKRPTEVLAPPEIDEELAGPSFVLPS